VLATAGCGGPATSIALAYLRIHKSLFLSPQRTRHSTPTPKPPLLASITVGVWPAGEEKALLALAKFHGASNSDVQFRVSIRQKVAELPRARAGIALNKARKVQQDPFFRLVATHAQTTTTCFLC